MPHKQLPTRLGLKPIVDAVFEIRFDCEVSAADIIPGFLHSKLGGDLKLDRLPVSQLPLELRQKDPNLANQPLVRIIWQNSMLLVGDKTFAVACLLPYPGWAKYREVILKTVGLLADAAIVRSVERYSLKYVDMLPAAPGENVSDWINMKVLVGSSELKAQPFQLHMELVSGNYVHVLLIGSPAQAQAANLGEIRQGMIISVDTISANEQPSMGDLISQLEARIDDIHTHNKQVFFDCLTVHGVEKLEPSYD